MLDALITALTGTGYSFEHYGWSKAPAGDYGVYAEDGGNDLEADGLHSEKALTGTVDFFTRDDSDTPRTTIEAALETCCVWSLNSIQFESDSGYIHYEWVFEVV